VPEAFERAGTMLGIGSPTSSSPSVPERVIVGGGCATRLPAPFSSSRLGGARAPNPRDADERVAVVPAEPDRSPARSEKPLSGASATQ
jgi:hypothetical protein